MSRSIRWRGPVAVLALVAVLAGCASVPDSSPVQVLKQVTDGDAPPVPPGPVEDADAAEIVRGFVNASGLSSDSHGAARRFLAPEAAAWEDGGGLTILDGQLDTVPAPGAPSPSTGATTIRIRGTAIGRVTPSGAFEPDESPLQVDVSVVRRGGQWRISALPDGVLVPLPAFGENYRAVKVYFADPVRRVAVADLRYLPAVPARAQSARVLELLLAGPSDALRGAAGSQLNPDTRLRSNVAASADGALVVDLTRVGELDEAGRRLLAAQVVLSLAEVDVERVRLLVDGEPLLPGGDLTPASVAVHDGEVRPGADVAGLVASGGRLRQLTGPEPGAALVGPVGNGALDVASAATTGDGARLAVVVREGTRQRLLLGGGPDGGVSPTELVGGSMTRPTWTPSGSEVWTVRDTAIVDRVLLPDVSDQPGAAPRTAQVDADALTALGPVTDLRLSRDGMRVVAVVGGALHTAAVARGLDGEVSIRNVRRLRPASIGEVVGADWRAADSVVAITRSPARPVVQVSVDGLALLGVPGTNLTPPLRSVAAGPGRPLMVTDAGGVWSFSGGDQVAWRAVLGGAPDAVPMYPG
ncbi:MAG: LpqB family beta-propeller domain-containing protein [Pseudonocardia sp.]